MSRWKWLSLFGETGRRSSPEALKEDQNENQTLQGCGHHGGGWGKRAFQSWEEVSPLQPAASPQGREPRERPVWISVLLQPRPGSGWALFPSLQSEDAAANMTTVLLHICWNLQTQSFARKSTDEAPLQNAWALPKAHGHAAVSSPAAAAPHVSCLLREGETRRRSAPAAHRSSCAHPGAGGPGGGTRRHREGGGPRAQPRRALVSLGKRV